MISPVVRIPVNAIDRYDVTIGRSILSEIRQQLDGVSRIAIVIPEVLRTIAEELIRIANSAGAEVTVIATTDGESQKHIDSVARAWIQLAEAGFTRTDLIVGVGGGATTDLAGFIAATWLRGIRWIAIPTTLAGMVDAAIGGKTGINIAAGKNLVGAFHSPLAVFCDIDFLSSLDDRDISAGLAEVVKCGFISDPQILEIIEKDPEGSRRWDNKNLFELIERSVRVKAHVVGADFKEDGLREILNYGHTLGHAIERNEGFLWRHGEAVSVGLVYAAELAKLTGRLDDLTAERHSRILKSLDLPVTYDRKAWKSLLGNMSLDKKTRDKRLRFVILDGLALPGRLEDPDPMLLERAYEEVGR
jgi:3-dehydroquinate synthase